jgi:hypothetical protein
MPQGILAVWSAVDVVGEEDYNVWYDREHLYDRVDIPGFYRRYHYVTVATGTREQLCTLAWEGRAASSSAAPGNRQLVFYVPGHIPDSSMEGRPPMAALRRATTGGYPYHNIYG